MVVANGIFDAELAAPGMTEEMDPAEAERIAHRLHFARIAGDSPEAPVPRLARLAASQLIVRDDPVAMLGDG